MVKSAQAVKTAMSILEPMLSSEMKLQPKGKILLATVQEDVHDIGKNIVALFLKNNGYIVIDLGKDVPNTTIVSKVESEKPDFLALSALMTTTMKHMKTINNLLNKAKIKIPMIIGGACVDKDFADSIGAYYAADPTSAISVLDKINNTF
jgi:5-methyltetrahydrofolate--homocysteine methyltransferase